MSKMIVAIDGPSGAGKSTLGRKLATALGLLYLDTGAMYRAVALAVLEAGESPHDPEESSRIAANVKIELAGAPADLRTFLDGRDVSAQIRTEKVSQAASIVSAIARVRQILVEQQRELGNQAETGCVLDGRDIGTNVFPNADVKFFLTADPASRARRRFQELTESKVQTSFEETLSQITERDARDANRRDSPLQTAPDAIVIDSTRLSAEEVFAQMLRHAAARQKAKRALDG